MKTYLYPADLHGCGYYRLIFAAKHLQTLGHDVVIVPPNKRHLSLRGGTNAAGEMVEVTGPPDADVIVLQRITHRPVADAIPLLRAQGIAVVVDIDDDLDAIDPQNPAWASLHPLSNTEHDWASARLACERATMVTVSTDPLAKLYAPHGRARVLPNCVPELFLKLARVDSAMIGWGGSIHSHPNDLQATGDAMRRLVREGYVFQVVGPPDGVRDALGLPHEPLSTGPVDIGSWAPTLSGLGVGIVPLAETRFNRAKSHLKLLEKSAVGVPAVASALPEYEALHVRSGMGVLARSRSDWYREVKRLCDDEQWRNEVSLRSRAGAARWTVEGNSWRWLEAWTDALRFQRAGSRSPFSRT